jgi:hypothetical protein
MITYDNIIIIQKESIKKIYVNIEKSFRKTLVLISPRIIME